MPPCLHRHDVHAWRSEPCTLIRHELTGLRFFVWDNRESQQTDVVIWEGLADQEIVQQEAERAGMMVDQFKEHLAELAQNQAGFERRAPSSAH
jgi:hypothetical protein